MVLASGHFLLFLFICFSSELPSFLSSCVSHCFLCLTEGCSASGPSCAAPVPPYSLLLLSCSSSLLFSLLFYHHSSDADDTATAALNSYFRGNQLSTTYNSGTIIPKRKVRRTCKQHGGPSAASDGHVMVAIVTMSR